MVKVVLAFILCLPFVVIGQDKDVANENQAVSKEGYISDYEIVKLTSGPKQHWFGYYDKLQVDPTGRYVLVAQVDTIHRSPTENDSLVIGMIDIHDNNKWIPLGESHAWGWQQGCMLQWIPGSKEEIIWNDVEDGKFVSRILNVFTKEKRTLPKAVYTLSNDGSFALGTEFNRIQKLRPGYGYAGVPDPFEQNRHPDEIGLYKLDLKTGRSELLISIDEMAKQEHQGEDLKNYWHWFNHILISPDDQRFIFLHRWRKEKENGTNKATSGFITRMITADINGGDRYILDPSGYTSHFIWKNSEEVCMWTKPLGKDAGFYRFTDKTDKVIPVGQGIMTANGHNTYINGTSGDWILNDTYPQGDGRLQELYLYHVPTKKKVSLGKFHQPLKYKSEVRCDLHPRNSRNGNLVFFDSTHGGDGRQLYMVNISKIIE